MRLFKSEYTLNSGNYRKKTPIQLKFWADLGLLVSAIGDIILISNSMPEFPGDDWVKYFLGVALPSFKLITTFVSLHPKQ